MLPRFLPTVLVAEAPPRAGLGPLGVLDCDSGLRFARLDPANAADLAGKGTEPARTRRCVERTLGLFERVNLLPEHLGRATRRIVHCDEYHAHREDCLVEVPTGRGDAFPLAEARAAWAALAPRLAWRRAALVGRAAQAAGFKGLLPLRWLRLGGEGEPREVCCLPHPSGVCRWYNDAGNREAVGRWLAAERRRAEAVERAWCAAPGGGWAYHYVLGDFGRILASGHAPTWDRALHADVEIFGRLVDCAAGIRRFGGGGIDLLSHSLVALAALDPSATTQARRLALVHDHHEPLVADLSTPLKRIVGEEWRECEQVAARAVERIAGVTPTAADREAVRVADQVALRVEGRALGVDLGDPAELGPDAAERATRTLRRLRSHEDGLGSWWSAWRVCEVAA